MPAPSHRKYSSPTQCSDVANDVIRGDYAAATYKLSTVPKKSLNFQFYRSLIRDCSRAHNFVACQWIVAHMRSSGVKLNVVAINSIISCCAQSGASQIAARWVVEMESMLITPNRITYNTVIKACVQARDLEGAQEWLQTMTEQGISPCVISFGLLIDAFAKAGDIAGAECWFARLEASGVQPDLIIFNCLINAAARCGNSEKARIWLERMAVAGIQPDERSYNCVIDACAKGGDVEEAEEWMRVMEAKGLAADEVTYGSLLNACAKRGDVDRAERWIELMIAAGLEPNQVCQTIVIHACARAGDRDRAEKWFYKVECHSRRSPNRIAYNCVVCACIKAQCLDAAEDWLERMAKAGLVPDMATHSSVMRVIQEMWSTGADCEGATKWAYTTLIRIANEHGNAIGALKFAAEARKSNLNVKPLMRLGKQARPMNQPGPRRGSGMSSSSMTIPSLHSEGPPWPVNSPDVFPDDSQVGALAPPSDVPISPWIAMHLGHASAGRDPLLSEYADGNLCEDSVLVAQVVHDDEDDRQPARQAYVPGVGASQDGPDLDQFALGLKSLPMVTFKDDGVELPSVAVIDTALEARRAKSVLMPLATDHDVGSLAAAMGPQISCLNRVCVSNPDVVRLAF